MERERKGEGREGGREGGRGFEPGTSRTITQRLKQHSLVRSVGDENMMLQLREIRREHDFLDIV